MSSISPLSIGAASPIYARRGEGTAVPTAGPAKPDNLARGPAVVLGGGLTSVSAIGAPDAIGATPGMAPVPPVKPVVYRPGATVNVSI